jgi:Polymer-forming cytoskeletal
MMIIRPPQQGGDFDIATIVQIGLDAALDDQLVAGSDLARESDLESGLFKGSAAIEDAEIRGRFEGDLVVSKRLLIKASGRVSGTVRYGQIEIECGGQISGDIQAQPSSEPGEVMTDVAAARAAG